MGEEEQEVMVSGSKHPATTKATPKLSILPLIALIFYEVSGGPFGVEDSVKAGGGPLLSLLGFLIFPFFWSIPEALVTAELATSFPDNGGYVLWISSAFGTFWGFQEGFWKWVSGVMDNALYPVLFLDYLKHSFPIFNDAIARVPALLGITLLLTYLNYRGLHIVGFTAVLLACFSLLPFVVMAVLSIPRIRPSRWLVVDRKKVDLRGYFNSLFWNLNYWDNASTLAGEIENPSRTFPRALLGAVVLVVCSYLIPLLAGTGAVETNPSDWSDGYFARNRNKGHDGEVEGSGSQQPLSTAKNGRKRKSEVLRSPRLSNALVQPRERRNIDSLEQDRDVASTRKRNKDSDGEVKGAGSEQPSSTAKNGRKRKSEVSRSPRVSNAKDDGENGSNGGEVSRKPKKIDVAAAQNTSEAREESETVTTPRERKKSKYLSPPYTNLAWRLGNSSFKSQSQAENGDATWTTQAEERKEERENAADQPIIKSVDNESSVDADFRMANNTEKLSFPVSDVDVPVDELLSEIQHAALDPFYLSEKGSLDKIWGFVSALRSSTYMHGLDYKLYQKRIAGENQKLQPSELKDLRNELTEKNTKSPDQSSPRASKKQRTSDTCMSKKAAHTNDATATTETVERKDLPCLTLAFNPEARLPSKKEVVELFAKFGSLNTKETKVETDSHSVRAVYTNESDAVAAFKSSLRQSPFGSENVNYRLLQRSEAGTKLGSCADDLLCDVNTMRQKLEITTALLENYNSKFSWKDKSNVKEEMKRLLEKIETVGDKVRAIAEKSSSIPQL